jgi:TetR/AcrR family transcriptional regulator
MLVEIQLKVNAGPPRATGMHGAFTPACIHPPGRDRVIEPGKKGDAGSEKSAEIQPLSRVDAGRCCNFRNFSTLFDCSTYMVERSKVRSNPPELSQEKQTLILNAAQTRFARYGFSKVTMDEIAEDVGMAKASLYYYYPTKEDLFRSVIEREQAEFLRQMTAILQQKISAGKKLSTYVENRVKLTHTLLNLSSLNLQLWKNPRPGFESLFTSFANEELRLLIETLREGKQSGEFGIASPEKTALMLLHVLQALRLHPLRNTIKGAGPLPADEELEKETCLLMETLLHGLIKRNGHS